MQLELVTSPSEVKSIYSDLINNYQEFRNQYPKKYLLGCYQKWKDDCDYSNYPSIDDLLKDMTPEDMERSHVVRVPISAIYSSEESKGGFDRPLWSIQTPSAKKQQEHNLNLNKKGYSQECAAILGCILRPDPKDSKKWILVKWKGNNRLVMKLFCNDGDGSIEVLVSLTFHTKEKTQDECIQKESELHSTDAGERSGQNELQKFFSGFRAGRKEALYCFDFLKFNHINYGTLMQQEGIEGSDDWITLTNITGLSKGPGNGFFRKYTDQNVRYALDTIKLISEEITKEKEINSTAVEAFALMFSIYTVHGKSQKALEPLFTVHELQEFFLMFFESKQVSDDNFGISEQFKIKDLAVKSGVKETAYICAKTFWPLIVHRYKKMKNSQNGGVNGFSVDCYANQKMLEQCGNKMLKEEMTQIFLKGGQN